MQSDKIQELEQALTDANIEYELQKVDVVDSVTDSDGAIRPYVFDVDLRIHD